MFRRRRSSFRRGRSRSADPRLLAALGLVFLVALIGAFFYFLGVADRVPPPIEEKRIELPNAIKP